MIDIQLNQQLHNNRELSEKKSERINQHMIII